MPRPVPRGQPCGLLLAASWSSIALNFPRRWRRRAPRQPTCVRRCSCTHACIPGGWPGILVSISSPHSRPHTRSPLYIPLLPPFLHCSKTRPSQVLGKPVTTYKDIASRKLSSMPASAPPKNALAVCADPNGQVSLTLPPQPHTSRHNHSHVQPLHYPPPPPQSKIAPSGIVMRRNYSKQGQKL